MSLQQQLLTCPFNPAHVILPHRMQKHLVRCKKQYPNIKLQTCLYNATHLIKPELFEEHKATCSDRKNFTQVLEMVQQVVADAKAHDASAAGNSENTDEWEEETNETWGMTVRSWHIFHLA